MRRENIDVDEISTERGIVAKAAAKALKETDDYIKAAHLMETWCRADHALLMAVVENHLFRLCLERVGHTCRDSRRVVFAMAQRAAETGNARLQLAVGLRLMEERLPGGKLLCDATAADLLEAERFYRAQADDMSMKADWYARIRKRVGTKRVGKVLTEKDLAKIHREVSHA